MVAVGEKVFGKYEVLRRLAVGGMGEIFLSRQRGVIDRLVILKNLLPQLQWLARPDYAHVFYMDQTMMLLADAKKMYIDVNPVSAKALDELLAELYATPKDVLKKAGEAITK